MKSHARAAMLLLSVSLFGCGDDPQGRPEPATSTSGAVEGPNLGGKLGNAADSIAGASSKPLTRPASPTGIFDEGLGDKAFALNAARSSTFCRRAATPRSSCSRARSKRVQSLVMKVELEGALPLSSPTSEIGPPKAGAPAPAPSRPKTRRREAWRQRSARRASGGAPAVDAEARGRLRARRDGEESALGPRRRQREGRGEAAGAPT